MHDRRRTARRNAAALLVAALALMGCTGEVDDDLGPLPPDAGAPVGPGAGLAAPPGAPIRLMTISPETGPVPVPEVGPAARAAAAAINADGGVRGHQIEILTCDSRFESPAAADCATRAVEEQVTAVVGAVGPGGNYLSILSAAGIPVVANLADSTAEAMDPISYPIHATALQLVAAAAVLKAQGVGSVQYMGPDLPAYKEAVDTAEDLLAEVGVEFRGSTVHPVDAGPLEPVVKEAYDAGADGVAVTLVSSQSVSAFAHARTRLGSAAGLPTAALGTSFPPSALQGRIGAQLAGIHVVNGGHTPSDAALPAIKNFQQEYATQSGTIEYSDNALAAWVGVHAIAKLLRGADGDITSPLTLRQALAKGPIDTPGWMPFDFSRPALVGDLGKAFPRLGTNTVWVSRIERRGLVPAVDEPQPFTGPIELRD